MPLSIFDQTWDHVFSFGTKCNTHAIRRKLGIPGFSSPFDNMDSVHGLRDCARVAIVGPSVYFGDMSNWVLRNEYAPRSMVVRSKALYNTDYPGLFYPHFHPGWFDQSVVDKLDDWIHDPGSTIDVVWDGFSSTFARRLERLSSFLTSGKKILFLRIDEKNSLSRIYTHGNTLNDLVYSASILREAGFQNFHILYVYARTSQYFRDLSSGSHWDSIGVEADDSYDDVVSRHLSLIRLAQPVA